MAVKRKISTGEVVRCAAIIPGGYQCKKVMYHVGDCEFFPVQSFSIYVNKTGK